MTDAPMLGAPGVFEDEGMRMMVRYLSKEWENEQWKGFEEEILRGDDSDCGWGADGPCGGCGRCMSAQFSYGIEQEKKWAKTLLDAGFDVAPRNLVVIGYFHLFGGYHDSYNCMMANEREGLFFPWEKRGS